MTLSKKIRFDVFKRDNFTCQYCGKKPPEVILEIDHIIPVSKRGGNEIENLLTSCVDCNRGKGDRKLTEPIKVIEKNIEEIKEKSNQLEEFYKYQVSIGKLREKQVKDLVNYWAKLWPDYDKLKKFHQGSLKRFLVDFSILDISEAMDISTKIPEPNRAFRYMCGVLYTKLRQRNE